MPVTNTLHYFIQSITQHIQKITTEGRF